VTESKPPRKGGGVISSRGVRFAVKVEVDGTSIELKEFLHDVIGGAVDGLLAGLRAVDHPKSIKVDVTRL
jgi:hypothetical protein